ncbi:hypothetical protein [Actinoallomurus iriomotensis]|uniref:Uncharacterized protein n=1 Tax=Actinoallomurus iriomotensis TaxID=478107 RepID=A0A9W6VZZ5_9ACTN|nr:hypothetical protein [Actinoallomurus iriomotensis]GLY85854.1 hypothetical protein Airi02_037830 [Actinoallomurus iriomotensis]
MDSDSKQTGRTAEADPGLLGVYLNDHLAGATLGSELSARLVSAHRDSEDGAVLERLATEIREDRAALIELMAALEVPVRQYKVLLAWAAEKAGRFKPNGRLLERSPLSSLEELEAMTLGVVGKSGCWRVLRTLADHDDRLDPERLDDLLDRAERQAETLEELRLRAGARLATSAA